MTDKVYFKSNVVLEPLFMKWYVWPHLLFPPTAALNIVHRHLKIMDSYVKYPKIHEDAVKNPKMLGGPFMNYPQSKVSEIDELIKNTNSYQSKLLSLGEDIIQLYKLLDEKANGYSLDPLYEEIPEGLKGYVELFYDLNHVPGFRFFENLMYRSPYYDKSYQSFYAFEINDDEREFVLSTPRIGNEKGLHLPISYDDDRLDFLFKMQRHANSFEEIVRLFEIKEQDIGLFRSFFTETPPRLSTKFEENDKIKISYYGHACILIEINGFSILTDPVISYNYDNGLNRLTIDDLPEKIDCVCISHNHQDHVLIETLIQLRNRIGKIVVPSSNGGILQDPSIKNILKQIGFKNIIELEELESISESNITITGIPFLGEHSDLWIKSKLCFHIDIHSTKILFAADTCNVNNKMYEFIEKEIGKIDILFLGMECDGAPLTWLYGPLLPKPIERKKDYSRRLSGSNFQRAKNMVDCFKPNQVYVYAMGQEPWLDYIMAIEYTPQSDPIIASNDLIQYCSSMNIEAERLFLKKQLIK